MIRLKEKRSSQKIPHFLEKAIAFLKKEVILFAVFSFFTQPAVFFHRTDDFSDPDAQEVFRRDFSSVRGTECRRPEQLSPAP
jgi:hypothetical protein